MSGVSHLGPKNHEVYEAGHGIARIKLLFAARTAVVVLLYHEPLGIGGVPVAYDVDPTQVGVRFECLFVIYGDLISVRRLKHTPH